MSVSVYKQPIKLYFDIIYNLARNFIKTEAYILTEIHYHPINTSNENFENYNKTYTSIPVI